MHRARGFALLFTAALTLAAAAAAQEPDLTKQPALYVVGYAHLDTQWRWEYPQTIDEFLPRTMHDNFALFAKYPHYVFNFSGANRYRLMKEYYPADFARLQQFVKSGQWFPSGSSMEEGDVNSPSAESIIRQILYGTHFFRRELGRTSAEYMLPDCFGFPASLPSILAHLGIRGFSTQKLTWGSSAPVGGEDSPERTPRGTPFNVGIWEGPDGKSIIAAFNPGSYGGEVRYELSASDPSNKTRGYVDWPARVARDGEVSGVFADYHYYGTGDVGGAPAESSVAMLEKIVSASVGERVAASGERGTTSNESAGSSPLAARPNPLGGQRLHIVSATAEQMFLDIHSDQTAGLPRYRGDLELTNHSAGSLTSEAMQKRWNHDNELLADAAEKAAVGAMLLGRPYPQGRLNDAWTLVMGGQFHDIAAGTATPKAYEYSWNDDVIARNQFTAVRNNAVRTIASVLDTRTSGTPVVVYNPLSIAREDVVAVPFEGLGEVRVAGPDGVAVPAQRNGKSVLFLAKVPSTGFAVYDVQPATAAPKSSQNASLKVSESSLENDRYRIAIDANGDVASILDKKLDKQLLAAPLRLAFQTENPHDWPAWNMDWNDQKQPPRGYVSGPAKIRVVERGPARVAVEVSRDGEDSHFVQTVSLSAGDAGNRIEVANAIDWKTAAAALKATFPFTASNPLATYNWEVGTIERGNDNEKQFEVPSHEWIDLTDAHGGYGVTVLTGAKYGSDKPDDSTLRLTLLYTPGLGSGNGRSYSDQTSQDWGHHEFIYGLASHGADRGSEGTDWQALRLSDPLTAFVVPKHAGPRGKTVSLVQVSNPRVRVLALKKAEESDEIIVRAVNLDPQPQWAHLTFAEPVTSGRAVNGQELPIGPAETTGGTLLAQFEPFGIRSFALKLALPSQGAAAPNVQPLTLTFDRVVATHDGEKSEGGFDAQGQALPAEMLPPRIMYGDVAFDVTGKAVTAHGQTVALPHGITHVHILAASAEGDRPETFHLGEHSVTLTIHAWNGCLGQWDARLWQKREEDLPPRPDAPLNAPPRKRMATVFAGLTPGYIKDAPLAWYASHHHTAEGKNVAYAYSYLFAYTLDVPAGATTLTLPEDGEVRVMAVTVTSE